MKDLKILKDFQDLEQAEEKLKKGLQSLPQPEQLHQLKRDILADQETLKGVKDEFDSLKFDIKRVENLLEEQKVKLNKISEKLFSGEITNLKELDSMNEEKRKLDEEINKFEESFLIKLEDKDRMKKNFLKINEKLKKIKDSYKNLLEKYYAEKESIEKELENTSKLKERLIPKIDNQLLKEYNNKKENFVNRVVVEVKKQTCQGCNLSVSFDILKKVKLKEEIARCDKCGRILISN